MAPPNRSSNKNATHSMSPMDANMQKEQTVSVVEHGEEPNSFLDEALLTCDICLEVMHNAMNISPCNHKFCAACIYEWLDQNKTCPKCRWHTDEVTRDALVNQILEQYLTKFPNRRRSEALLAAQDERELHLLKKKQANRSRESSPGNSDDSDPDSDVEIIDEAGGQPLEQQQQEQPDRDLFRDIAVISMNHGFMLQLGRQNTRNSDDDDDDTVYSRGRDNRYRHAEEDARILRLQRQKEEREAMMRQSQGRNNKTTAVRCQDRRVTSTARQTLRAEVSRRPAISIPFARSAANPYNLRSRRGANDNNA